MATAQENFLFYSDYFAYIAEAGLNRARELFPAIATSTQVDVTSIINRRNADVAIANMTRMLDTSYEYLWLDGQHIDPIRDAFNGLSAYILKTSGLDVNSYIEQEGITVLPLYARLANIFGETVEDENLRT